MNDSVRAEHSESLNEADDRIQIRVEQVSEAVVMRLTGDLDMLTSSVLHERLWPHLDQTGRAVVLDLTEVGFLGSAGLSELVAANDTASKNGVPLLLVATGRAVLRPLEITGLRPLFGLFSTVDEALRATGKV